ncbi:hypothetical protein [Paraburkholderia hospita]|uniref:hypothetical protein n=1 Tax=Paraburkholderia hospita TaxID=169430 RepID=UPI003ED16D45
MSSGRNIRAARRAHQRNLPDQGVPFGASLSALGDALRDFRRASAPAAPAPRTPRTNPNKPAAPAIRVGNANTKVN